jgi:hypothetical protein
MEHRIEAGQRRQVYDRGSGDRWYVDITDEFLHGLGRELRHGIDVNANPNLNGFNNGLIAIEPLHPPQDFVIGDEYVETPEFRLDEFPFDEQVHYGFIMPGLERQHDEHMEDDDEHPDPLDGHILRVVNVVNDDDPDPWAAMWNALQQPPNQHPNQPGGRTRRRKSKGKSKGKSKCKGKGKCKSKKTVKTRKCIRHRRAHK